VGCAGITLGGVSRTDCGAACSFDNGRKSALANVLSIRNENAPDRMAGTTGLEPATSAVTGQRSNQLNYVPREGKTSVKSTELYRISGGMHNRW
jgi:hypothetical protein